MPRMKPKGRYRFSILCCFVVLTLLLNLVGVVNPFMTGIAAADQNPVLELGSVSGNPGEEVRVPLTLTSSGQVVGLQFDLSYDHDLLTYQGRTYGDLINAVNDDGDRIYTIATNHLPDGKFRLMVYSIPTTPMPSGSGTVVELRFLVAAGAAAGQTCALEFSGVILADRYGEEAIPTTVNNGQFSVPQGSVSQPPALTADSTDNTVGQDVYLSFTDDEAWRNAISEISVDGSAVDSGKYTIAAGSITIDQSVFTTAKDYTIAVSAAGYNDASVTQTMHPASTSVWDGSIDVTWYNTTDSVFYIDTPAKLAGLAAIVNGIYNTGATVTGNPDYIVYNVGGGTLAGSTTATWVYGGDDFTGKTVYLTTDLDMGGVYDSTTQTWSGPNYMPIGGQYCMTYQDGTTLIGSSWNGTFDGQGHTVKNIYCSRHAGSLGYEYSQSVGLIGRMGVHDNDPTDWYTTPSVKNVAVTGSIYANRSVGGIVGKNGRSIASVIENCINYASVSNTDAKGVGGIAGAGWNNLTIKNCANLGTIYTSYSNAGGISGSCEAKVFNSYNVGYVGASAPNQAQSLGTNNGGAVWINCYWLNGSSASNEAVYNSIVGSTITKMDTEESMKTADSLAALNGDGRAWVADTQNINSGYPIPRTWTADTATLTSITKESDPTNLSYIAGQTFDAAGLAIWANYSDGTRERVADYTISKTTPLEETDTTITVSGTYGGMAYSYDFTITVGGNALDNIAITTQPLNLFYAAGETFNTAGMVVRATYTNGTTATLTADEYTLSPDAGTPLTPANTKITVSYTYNGVTRTVDQPITVLASAAPNLNGDVYELATADHMLWFANQVNTSLNNAVGGKLMNDIDLSGAAWTPIGNSSAAARKYAGVFDGNGKTITLALMQDSAAAGLFGYLNGATVKNLTVAGSVAGGQYTAGIAGHATAATIENCVNNATVTSTSQNVGGIAGYTTGGTRVIDCVNNGSVTATYNVGGIAGNAYGADTISKCANNGAVTATSTATTTSYSLGGIVGYAYAASTIELCYNTGTIKGGVVNVGGVAGYLNNASAKLTDAYNTGDVLSESTSGTAHTGGLVGTANNASSTVQNCYNAGSVTASNTGAYTAGVIGYARGNTNVSNNYYLDTTATKGLGNTADNTVSKTSEELKSAEFAVLLGAAYAAQANDYPILTWQGPTAPETYTVTVDGSISGGTVTIEPASGTEGTTITVTVTPDSGKRLVAGSLKYNGGNGDIEITATEGVYSFAMPAADVVVTAQFEEIPAGAYTVTVDGSITGGSVGVNPASAAAGETITVTVTPDSSKRLVAGSLKYNDGSGDIAISVTEGVYSFVMPAANVVVTAQFEDLPADSAPKYTVTPVEDASVYEVGETGGIKTMTVKAGVIGLKYFGTQLTPVTAHEGKEVVVFVHLRGGVQLSLNVTKADFDFVNMAQAGFNVEAGDIVKVFIVDNLTNDTDFNPTLLQ